MYDNGTGVTSLFHNAGMGWDWHWRREPDGTDGWTDGLVGELGGEKSFV